MSKQRHIGYMIYYDKFWFSLARRLFGKRWLIVHKDWNVYQYVMAKHIRGETPKGERFVYCPTSLIVSWSTGDYDHEWCHACQQFFSDKANQLIEGDNRYAKLP